MNIILSSTTAHIVLLLHTTLGKSLPKPGASMLLTGDQKTLNKISRINRNETIYFYFRWRVVGLPPVFPLRDYLRVVSKSWLLAFNYLVVRDMKLSGYRTQKRDLRINFRWEMRSAYFILAAVDCTYISKGLLTNNKKMLSYFQLGDPITTIPSPNTHHFTWH